MGLTNESKNVVDKEIKMINDIIERLQENIMYDISDDYTKRSAIAIYLKKRNDLRFDDDND